MALFLDPDNDEDEDAFGGGAVPAPGQAGRLAGDKPKKPKTPQEVLDKLAANQRRRRPTPQGMQPMFPGMINDAQAGADAVMAAHRRENDSRVAQMREMRRLAASQAEEQMKYDYLLKKLAVEQAEREKDRQMQQEMAVGRGLLKKVRRNDGQGGGWYTDYEPV
jgi:hypothetical protein